MASVLLFTAIDTTRAETDQTSSPVLLPGIHLGPRSPEGKGFAVRRRLPQRQEIQLHVIYMRP